MKSILTALIFFLLSTIILGEELNTYELMPLPQEINETGSSFRLDKNFDISISGNPADRLFPAATRTLRRLSGRTGLFFPQDFITKESFSDTSEMIIEVERPGKIELGQDESYSLNISGDKIKLSAPTDLGAMHGLQTLFQLLQSDEEGYFFPGVEIKDAPRFPWRGLMIDAARHFMPVDMVKRNLDGMAAVKMNVLHWHLSDNQGFRIESKSFPKLHELGSDGFYYSQAQIKDVIKYANDRGIRVYPEFDVPGHSTPFLVAYPELAAAPGPYTIDRNWGILDPTLDPTKEYTYEFLDTLFGEMSQLFPDEYFHIGGDEVNGVQWNANEDIQNYMKENNIEDNYSLQTIFTSRVNELLTKHGKKMVGWDEILQPGTPKNIVIQSWRGPQYLVEAAKKGYRGMLSNGYYIDLIQPAKFHYLNDPIPDSTDLTEEERENILGGEATMWAELVTPENVDSRIWPRTAAIAERFWSPQEVRDVNDMYKRMERISFLLEDYGLEHQKNYAMMLRRLTNNNDIEALKTFTDVIEPVKIYTRHRQGVKYTSYSPYTRAADAARPESITANRFEKLVDKYLNGQKENLPTIEKYLNTWSGNYSDLEETIKKSPILKEVSPMSKNLRDISEAALDAINYLEEGKPADEEWLSSKIKLLEEAKEPYGQAELAVVNPIEKLILAVKEKE